MRFALRRPSVRSAAVTVAIVFAIGIAIGAAVGPAAVGETGAAQRPTIVLASAPAAVPLVPADSAPLDDESSADDDAFASDEASLADEPAASEETSAEPAASETPAATDPNTATSDPADDGEDPAADVVPSGSKPLAGVVVEMDADGQTFALAARDGRLRAIHAAGCDVVAGDDLHLRAHKLADGTWVADRIRRVGEAVPIARAEGVVSWIDPAGGRYALAAGGKTLLVTIPVPTPDPAAPVDPATGAPAIPAPAPPPVLGERLRVRLQLQPAEGDVPASLAEQARMGISPPDPSVELPAPPELDGTSTSTAVDDDDDALVACTNLDAG